MKLTENFSSSIGMEFRIYKCAVIHMERGIVVNSNSLQLSETMCLRSLSEVETYKYLGISESLSITDGDINNHWWNVSLVA